MQGITSRFFQKNATWLEWVLVFGLALVFFSWFCWAYPLFDVDEPRYAETARVMLQPPYDWLTPHFNYDVRFDKPPLFYWLIALSYKLLGVSEGAARLISAISASLVSLGVYALAKTAWGRRTAVVAAVLFGSMAEPFVFSHWCITDMTLTMTMTGVWVGFYLALFYHPRWFLLAGLMAGLGLLTKGPVALALPGVTFIIMAVLTTLPATKSWFPENKVKSMFNGWMWLGLALSLAMAIPWYVAMVKMHPDTFGSQLYMHNITRFTSVVSGHRGSWYYYIPVLFVGTMPWTPWLLLIGLQAKRFLSRATLRENALITYGLIWFLFVMTFFSVSTTKLVTYILPAFPALSLILGYSIKQWLDESKGTSSLTRSDISIMVGVGILALGSLVAIGIMVAMPLQWIPIGIRSIYQPWPIETLVAFQLILVVGVLFLLWRKQQQWALNTMMVSAIGAYLLGATFILPALADWVQRDVLICAKLARLHQANLATYQIKKPSLVFYTRQKIHFIPNRFDSEPLYQEALGYLYDPLRPLYVVMKNTSLVEDWKNEPKTVIYQGALYSLVQVTANKYAHKYKKRSKHRDLEPIDNQ